MASQGASDRRRDDLKGPSRSKAFADEERVAHRLAMGSTYGVDRVRRRAGRGKQRRANPRPTQRSLAGALRMLAAASRLGRHGSDCAIQPEAQWGYHWRAAHHLFQTVGVTGKAGRLPQLGDISHSEMHALTPYPTGWGAQSQAGRFHSDSSPPPNRVETMSIAGI